MSFWDIPGQIRQAITHWLADLIRPFVTPLINSLVRALLTTPNPAEQPRVRELWETMRLISLGVYGLFVLATGITTMTHGSVQQRWGAQDVIPRLLLGIAASNLSLTICSTTLSVANAVAAAIFGEGITAEDVAGTLIGLLLAQISSPAAPLYLLVFTLAVAVLGSALLITALVRTAATIVLTVAAPLMLACHAHPLSDGIARLWWRAYLGCLGTEIAQAIVFLVCVKALLDPGNYGLIPVPDSAALINLMLLCCTLYLLIKVPSWIRRIVTTPARTVTGGGGMRIGGLRTVRKIALGALGMPMGPYAFGAQLAGKLRTARSATRAGSSTARSVPRTGRSRAGGAGGGPAGGRPPSGPTGPTGPRRPGGPSGGRPGAGPGSRTAGRTPGGGGPSSPGSGPGPSTPGSSPTGGASGSSGSVPQYQWGTPYKTATRPPNTAQSGTIGAANGPAQAPQALSGGTGRTGGGNAPKGSGGPHGKPSGASPSPPGPSTPPPTHRSRSAANLRPARANLPPPIPRPAPLRPPLDDNSGNSRRPGRS
ncbi:hypothetical protein ACIG0C_36015 [Kitasatospora aureofaciens]|uniref:Uncharacterized protein n=1 Tax=Kitasatospora aureofaciens TaxID=1894 RepID=A0A1E7NAR3_KITAU|nr:hypothetical protein [Kitasatospora aureofaciens]ARF78080.1 hypothetical protein B6264_03345 [Kitasatospora aureofaciens]OEV37785.1 hypothetical protein HS99_0024655 [Kitasatospora aureofaciens]GGV07681.1 hypothetical protein GCM10010502_73430 [Kitasatospora aureofaciens]